jgi:formate C-acetyltransferase
MGGMTRDGEDGCNLLTRMRCVQLRDVAMIDPKVNLRISAQTDLDLLSLATELARKGLGFPQYSNDDVVIPALVAHGYSPADAREYTVAACWVHHPGKRDGGGQHRAISFPSAADKAIAPVCVLGRISGNSNGSPPEILDQVDIWSHHIRTCCCACILFGLNGSLPGDRPRSLAGLVYNNFGIHGACSANAADALRAVKEFVFERKTVSGQKLLDALESNFAGHEALQQQLSNHGSKVGAGSDLADELLVEIFHYFAEACEAHRQRKGGIVRPGQDLPCIMSGWRVA